jgi:hypothetical protein
MLALSGTIVQGLKLRRDNSIDSQALAYATSILETYKNSWSSSEEFVDAKTPTLPATPPGLEVLDPSTDMTFTCLDAAGNPVSTNCDLRRVRVTVKDLKGKIYADLITGIGNPKR